MESNDANCQLRRNADGDEIVARIDWDVFRDRGPDLYTAMNRLDGR